MAVEKGREGGLATPLVNAATTDRHLGVTLPASDWALAGFDLSMLGLGLAFGWLAWKLTTRAGRTAQAGGKVARQASALQQAAE